MILTVENAHWAGALTLSHLARMTAAVRDCPAVLVLTTPIDGDPLDPAWRAEAGGAPPMTRRRQRPTWTRPTRRPRAITTYALWA